MSKLDERIVVAPRRLVFAEERLAFHGFLPLSAPAAAEVLHGLCLRQEMARRGDVEEDPALLQPIPYVVLTRRVEGRTEVFAYRRLAGGGERRLHGRISIGVGGHMNRRFRRAELEAVVQAEAGRELVEELGFRGPDGGPAVPGRARLLGLINDDSGEVQRVHIGLLARVEIPADWLVKVRETERLAGSWQDLHTLRNEEARARLEEWSVHALQGIAGTS